MGFERGKPRLSGNWRILIAESCRRSRVGIFGSWDLLGWGSRAGGVVNSASLFAFFGKWRLEERIIYKG